VHSDNPPKKRRVFDFKVLRLWRIVALLKEVLQKRADLMGIQVVAAVGARVMLDERDRRTPSNTQLDALQPLALQKHGALGCLLAKLFGAGVVCHRLSNE
jgi:hypothetical protein